MTRRVLLFILAGAGSVAVLRGAPAVGREKNDKAGRQTGTLMASGGERNYLVQTPTRYDGKTALPLVIFLHGRGGNGVQAERAYGWTQRAEQENFIVCYPSATRDPMGVPAWNAGYNAGRKTGTDDVSFLSDLIKHLQKTLFIDAKRVYLCGHSSGAMMTYRFAAERPNEVAAIAFP